MGRNSINPESGLFPYLPPISYFKFLPPGSTLSTYSFRAACTFNNSSLVANSQHIPPWQHTLNIFLPGRMHSQQFIPGRMHSQQCIPGSTLVTYSSLLAHYSHIPPWQHTVKDSSLVAHSQQFLPDSMHS